MRLVSSAFPNGGAIPQRLATSAFGGQNLSPPIEWADVPNGTRSFAVVLVDKAPAAHDWVHWMLVDLPADTARLAEGASPQGLPAGARELENTFGRRGYDGPQPPPGSGEHRYEVQVFALDMPRFEKGPALTYQGFLDAVTGHVLGTGTYAGTLGR